jgi:hypothetical protein
LVKKFGVGGEIFKADRGGSKIGNKFLCEKANTI